MKRTTLACAVILAAGVLGTHAQAQTANATSPNTNPSGPNEAPQFPSGGTRAPGGTAVPSAGQSQIGAPTEVEKQEDQKSQKATSICKGC